MKSITIYSARFRGMEYASYFLLAVPWLGWLLGEGFLASDTLSLGLNVILSAAILAFIFLLRDVRRKINSLDILKKDLALAAIHDLKGPLTSIIGSLSIVDEPEIDPEIREKLLKLASQSSKEMIKLIQVLLDTERMEITEMLLQKRPLDIRALVSEALSALEPVSAETGVKLVILIDPGLPPVTADHDLLMRVLENLVLNAFKYSHRGNEIKVKAGISGGMFNLEVSDEGAGIHPDDIKMVFEKYYRVAGQEGDSRKGSGFGLYFCRLAVEAHKGKITISSVRGHGTTVTAEMPLNP